MSSWWNGKTQVKNGTLFWLWLCAAVAIMNLIYMISSIIAKAL